jgi:peptide/nickel transport system substrate-binding protein/oligopeptide transport system substrate-binding protein
MIDERWQGRPATDWQASAAARIARWTRNGKPAVVRVALPVGPGADLVAARLTADFGAIGVKLERVGPNQSADLRLIDEVARYPRTAWFLNQLSCLNLRGPCSPAADLLAERARNTADPAQSADLLAQAEAALTKENIYIPLGGPVRWSLWSGSELGLSANRWGYHPLAPIAIRADTR